MKKFTASSARVKCVDFHPSEPWIAVSLYTGTLFIYNYKTQTTFKQIDVTEDPLRAIRFIARKQWIISASDDRMIRVHNFNTLECVKKWEGHTYFIRSLAVHPTLPLVLSCSDDNTIKLWNWERNFSLVRIFEGHLHYVIHVTFNPKDPNTFASASLDYTVKIWSLNSSTANLTLEGHEDGVNCVDYYLGGDKPYLVTGSDDQTVKIWDYHTKACVQTLEGHTDNVTSVAFHPVLPLLLSGSEDGSLKMWNSTTYRLEKSLNYGWERIWSMSFSHNTNGVAVGFDRGTMFLKLGKEMPTASMDPTGKVIFSKHNVLFGCNLQQALTNPTQPIQDGEVLLTDYKEMGTCEFYPQTLKHSLNGRLVAAIGNGDYVIYTALQVRAKKFGNAVDFVWDSTNGFAINEQNRRINIFDKSFNEVKTLRSNFPSDCLFGGPLLGVHGRSNLFLYDWASCVLVAKLDVVPKLVVWNEVGDHVAISTETSFYILHCDQECIQLAISKTIKTPGNPGIPLKTPVLSSVDDHLAPHQTYQQDQAFKVLTHVPEVVRSAIWVGDCLIFINNQNVLRYCVGKRFDSIAFLNRNMYLLGYLTRFERLVLIDKSRDLVTYSLPLAIISFHSSILRGSLDAAKQILPSIPESHLDRVANFLESQGQLEWALEVSNDPDHQFDLALQLKNIDRAYEIALASDLHDKWSQVAQLAMQQLNFSLAQDCFWHSSDYSSLLIMFTASGDSSQIERLAHESKRAGQMSVAFTCLWILNKVDECIDLLIETRRISDAVFMARSYRPSRLSSLIKLWHDQLSEHNNSFSNRLADPEQYPNLFPSLQKSLNNESMWESRKRFPDYPASRLADLFSGNMVLETRDGSSSPTTNLSFGENRELDGDTDLEAVYVDHLDHHKSSLDLTINGLNNSKNPPTEADLNYKNDNSDPIFNQGINIPQTNYEAVPSLLGRHHTDDPSSENMLSFIPDSNSGNYSPHSMSSLSSTRLTSSLSTQDFTHPELSLTSLGINSKRFVASNSTPILNKPSLKIDPSSDILQGGVQQIQSISPPTPSPIEPFLPRNPDSVANNKSEIPQECVSDIKAIQDGQHNMSYSVQSDPLDQAPADNGSSLSEPFGISNDDKQIYYYNDQMDGADLISD